jgi:hypothetical protein
MPLKKGRNIDMQKKKRNTNNYNSSCEKKRNTIKRTPLKMYFSTNNKKKHRRTNNKPFKCDTRRKKYPYI